MKELRIELKNTKDGKEQVLYILPMKNDVGDEEFLVAETMNGRPCMKFLVDEGYMHTYYWYEASQWTITNVMILED